MLKAYDEGKDLYAVIGSKCFKNNYYSNLEFMPVLKDCDSYECTIDTDVDRLLITDTVTLKDNFHKMAKNLVVGDEILLSDGTYLRIRTISIEHIYVDINKNY